LVQDKYKIGNDADRIRESGRAVSKGSRREHAVDTGKFSVIDVGNSLKIDVKRAAYHRKRGHERSVDHESPLDDLLPVIGGVEQRTDASEAENDYDP
jgi:hypothetical protein